ncbi:MAG: hypothetical protein ABIA04_06385 [Pseudomonadota bacterium]
MLILKMNLTHNLITIFSLFLLVACETELPVYTTVESSFDAGSVSFTSTDNQAICTYEIELSEVHGEVLFFIHGTKTIYDSNEENIIETIKYTKEELDSLFAVDYITPTQTVSYEDTITTEESSLLQGFVVKWLLILGTYETIFYITEGSINCL